MMDTRPSRWPRQIAEPGAVGSAIRAREAVTLSADVAGRQSRLRCSASRPSHAALTPQFATARERSGHVRPRPVSADQTLARGPRAVRPRGQEVPAGHGGGARQVQRQEHRPAALGVRQAPQRGQCLQQRARVDERLNHRHGGHRPH
ncbi:hypothetical protein ON010_g13828 [Phytophthora cinnamomi]|nr:hypothetical protein ON010_g13828 [Phytophthora cinnamomi]